MGKIGIISIIFWSKSKKWVKIEKSKINIHDTMYYIELQFAKLTNKRTANTMVMFIFIITQLLAFLSRCPSMSIWPNIEE